MRLDLSVQVIEVNPRIIVHIRGQKAMLTQGNPQLNTVSPGSNKHETWNRVQGTLISRLIHEKALSLH